MAELSVYDNDPTLYLFTSLTAGSSHIVTATSRIETILKANKIPFKGVDTATDDLARKLYGRRARGKKLPLLVKEGFVIADLEQVEEWNEYDELKEALGATSAPVAAPAKPTPTPSAVPAGSTTTADAKENTSSATQEQNLAIRQLGAEAAKVAASKKAVPGNITTTNPLLAEKVNSPATSSPTKGGEPDTSGILSPRSIPLPATPNPATSTATEEQTDGGKPAIPKIAQKPVHSPPSMHIDASNPDTGAPPISTTTAKSPSSSSSIKSPPLLSPSSRTSSGTPVTEFHGSKVEVASDEEISKVEQENRIDEVTSSDEEDSEDEEVDKDKGKPAKAAEPAKPAVPTDKEDAKEETPKQDAKDADKASESVKD